MKVGGSLGSKSTLSSLLKVWACSKVSGYPSLEKILETSMLKVAMKSHLTGCSGGDPQLATIHIKQNKLCHTSNKAAALQPQK